LVISMYAVIVPEFTFAQIKGFISSEY